ncbi:MAG: elongation factor P [Chloroflexi bacterium]|nr:elongation factor P [Chloroflexota bacterium]
MIGVEELRKGVTYEENGEIYRVLDYLHNKQGRGSATIRVKAYNLRSGAIADRTYPSGNRVQEIDLDIRMVQYLYNDGNLYNFMDQETFEQFALNKEVLGDQEPYLVENITLRLSLYDSQPVDIELPTTVDLKVTETAPSGFKGDTASGGTKPATLETGLVVNVPFFVETGDLLRIDTRSGAYVTRV